MDRQNPAASTDAATRCKVIGIDSFARRLTMERRQFLRSAALAGVALEARGGSSESLSCSDLSHQGPKAVVRGKQAVAASQHPIVTQTMLDVLKSGGNAVDAALAGAITQATIQIDMTNHTGTVTFLYWEAKSGK